MEKLYSVQDLCQRYGVKDFTVWDWIRKGKLKAFNDTNIILRTGNLLDDGTASFKLSGSYQGSGAVDIHTKTI